MGSLRLLTQSRWYALAEFAAAIASGFLWYAYPAVGWWPLVLVIPFLLLRIANRWTGFPSFSIQVMLLVFLATAAFGVWAAYSPENAAIKFRILLSAVLLFYAAAAQPKENLWPVTALLGVGGAVFSIYFTLTYDWTGSPADVDIVNAIGARWMAIRPVVNAPSIVDDVAGGILVILVPLLIAYVGYAWLYKRYMMLALGLVTLALVAAGLFLTGLRAAWLALAFGPFLAAILAAGQYLMGRYQKASAYNRIFTLVFLSLMVGGGALVIAFFAGEFQSLAERVDAYWAFRSRLSLYRDAYDLSGDVFLLGGGLASFPGLFSRYVLSIFDYYMGYSHNLYLDILIEQGVFGLVSFLMISLTSLWLLVTYRFSHRNQSLSEGFYGFGLLVSLLVMLVQGMLENSLYGLQGTPLLFLLPGFAYAASRENLGEELPARPKRYGKTALLYGAALIPVLILLAAFFRPIMGHLYANLGTIQMAKAELTGWPNRSRSEAVERSTLDPAVVLLNRGLEYDPGNRAANYRLGRLAMEDLDFETAIHYLEKAYAQDEHYHGIRKNLGYAYVWTGQIERAKPVLSEVSEAEYELGVYNWWWGTQNRDDLAAYASEMIETFQDHQGQ